MSKKSTKQAANYLSNEDDTLTSLYQKIAKLTVLNDALTPYLQPHQRKLCQVANVTASRLVILAANSSIATELRLLTYDILIKIKTDPQFANIREIQVKVSPHTHTPRNRHIKQKVAPLSKESAHIVEEIANSIDNEKLRKAMLKIAKNCEK